MTTWTTTSTGSHNNVAEFRAWAQEVEAALVAIGLVVTGDTGQVDLTTMALPAGLVYAGYRIYKTNDGLVDLYVKLRYGTGGSSTSGRVEIQVATGTNGAGTLTGNMTTAFASAGSGTAASKTNYGCGVTGCWWLVYGPGNMQAGVLPHFGFKLSRFVDATGAPTSDGFVLYTHSGSARTSQQVTLLPTASVQTAGLNVCLLPSSITPGNIGSDFQFWKHYTAQPRMVVNPFIVTCDNAAIPAGSQRALTILGTSRNYINPGGAVGFGGFGVGATSTTLHASMMIWQ